MRSRATASVADTTGIDARDALEAITSTAARYPAVLDVVTVWCPPRTGLERSSSGGDPDALAEAHNYRSLPTTPALWALSTSTATFVGLGERLPPETTFLHGDWGEGTVADGARWLGHEFVHHLLDVDARASASPT